MTPQLSSKLSWSPPLIEWSSEGVSPPTAEGCSGGLRESDGVFQVESELGAVENTEIAGEFHQQLDSILVVVTEQKISESDQKSHHQLITEAWWTAVSKYRVPQQQSVSKTELSPEQQPQPANAIDLQQGKMYLALLHNRNDPNLGENLKLLQSGVEGEVVSLQQNVMNVVEMVDQIVP